MANQETVRQHYYPLQGTENSLDTIKMSNLHVNIRYVQWDVQFRWNLVKFGILLNLTFNCENSEYNA